MGDESEHPTKKKGHRRLRRLIRLGLVAGGAAWLIKKWRSKSSPGDGLWRDGISGPGSTTKA